MKILHLDSNHDVIYEELSALGIENHVDLKSTKSEIENIISNYHGIVMRSRITVDKGFIEKAINLKFIARVGSGTENIDCEYLKEKKIELISSGEGNSNAVGEHALGLLLSLSKKITKSNIEMKNGIRKREENRGFEIEGKTIGLIGYGKTGKSFAKKLSGFNCNIIFCDIKTNLGDNYAREVKINELKETSDIISLHTNLNQSSRHIIDKQFIDDCKKSFCLINTARGECISNHDLIYGLESDKIIGAALDVLENENKDFEGIEVDQNLDKLKKFENVILTPHIAGWSKESKVKLAQITVNKIKEFLDL